MRRRARDLTSLRPVCEKEGGFGGEADPPLTFAMLPAVPEAETKPDARAPFVCTGCLRAVETFSQPCPRCGSRKIEHTEALRILRGPHWRELIQAERGLVH